MISAFLCAAERTKVSGSALHNTIEQLPKAAHHFCVKNKRIFYKKRKAQKQHKSSVSELFDLVTRTGIENLGALFVTCRDMQKRPKIRHFRTINKSSFILFFAKFLHS